MASDEHQMIVKRLIDHLQNKGLTITCAAYTGYDECEKVNRHEPDVMAMDDSGLIYIAEAETCDSLDDDLTKEQFQDFSDRVMTGDKRKVPFFIGIPSSCESRLLEILHNLGLCKDNVFFVKF